MQEDLLDSKVLLQQRQASLHHKSQAVVVHIGKISLDAENYSIFKFSILEE